MRGLVIYSGSGGMEALAEAVAEGLQAASFRVDLRLADAKTQSPVQVAPYDLVCVGSPVLGAWRGEYAEDIDVTIKRCTRLDGKQAAAFVKPKFLGTGKALRRLMALLERQGAWVHDFASVGTEQDARAFGQRLESIVKKGP